MAAQVVALPHDHCLRCGGWLAAWVLLWLQVEVEVHRPDLLPSSPRETWTCGLTGYQKVTEEAYQLCQQAVEAEEVSDPMALSLNQMTAPLHLACPVVSCYRV